MKSAVQAAFMVVATLTVHAHEARGQRASENVLAAAQDAFGTTLGDESIGLYSPSNARGFSPSVAGNIRLEGLYVNNPAQFNQRLIAGSTMHVGLSAQSYPFPAPTGIADYHLRLPGDDYALSAVSRFGPYDSSAIELDAQIPIYGDRLAVGIGFDGGRYVSDWRATHYTVSGAIIGRARIGDHVEIIPFWSMAKDYEDEFEPYIYTAGLFAPPKFDRSTSYQLDWAEFNGKHLNYGVIGRAAWSNWLFRAGIFRSEDLYPPGYTTFYLNTQADGRANRVVLGNFAEPGGTGATSGEARISYTFTSAALGQTVSVNVRGRSSERVAGPTQTFATGPAYVGTPTPFPKPPLVPTIPNREAIEQKGVGLYYEGRWADVGELSGGLQRVSYGFDGQYVSRPRFQVSADYWLYNATLAFYLSDKFAVYSSYARGLEDSQRAPMIAVNADQGGVPASITEQVDAGFRYTITPALKLVAGVFQVEKPFFGLDATNVYRQLGSIRHQGIEASLSSKPLDGLTLLTGFVWMNPGLFGELVTNGAAGRRPIGSIPFSARMNAQYAFDSWRGLSVDMNVTYDSPYFANIENTYKGSSITAIDLGARYRFLVASRPTALRIQVTNLLDTYEWKISGSDRRFQPTPPRKLLAQLTVDF